MIDLDQSQRCSYTRNNVYYWFIVVIVCVSESEGDNVFLWQRVGFLREPRHLRLLYYMVGVVKN
jgi:hypothetical protein